MDLQESTFGKRERCSARDDEMIKHLDVHQRQGLFERGREQFICAAGLGDTAWMIVCEDDPCRVVP